MMTHTPDPSARPGFTPVALETFRWPGGIDQALAVLRAEPAELAARFGIAFTRDLDDLDWHDVSVVRLPSGRAVMFVRHDNYPAPGTVVWVDRDDHLDDAWAELRSVLGIADDDASWLSEFMRTPAARDAA